MKQLTVKRLIELLRLVENKDALVELEGCDCEGQAVGIEEQGSKYGIANKEIVLITRS